MTNARGSRKRLPFYIRGNVYAIRGGDKRMVGAPCHVPLGKSDASDPVTRAYGRMPLRPIIPIELPFHRIVHNVFADSCKVTLVSDYVLVVVPLPHCKPRCLS